MLNFQRNNNVNIRYKNDIELVSIRNVIASNNIIDLIKVGDYVSTVTGECAVIAGVHNDINSKKYLRLCNCIGEYYEDDIKSIVTKEMFSNVEYRVETN